MFQEIPSIPVLVLVMPAVSGCMNARSPVARRRHNVPAASRCVRNGMGKLLGAHSIMKAVRPKRFQRVARDAFAAIVNAAMMRHRETIPGQACKSLIFKPFVAGTNDREQWHEPCFGRRSRPE